MQIKNLHFQYHKNAPFFFKGLSFHLEIGKIHALHGKNGTGKTLLLNLLNKNIPIHAIMRAEIFERKKTLLVNQRFDYMIADQFSFAANLKFACMNRFPTPFSYLKQPHFYPNFLKKFHIDMSIPAYQLSGGQRQILALLMALQQQASILLLDEPTATLDEQNARMVFDFLKTLALQNMTLLIVCHDRELINDYITGHHFYLEVDKFGLRKLRIQNQEE